MIKDFSAEKFDVNMLDDMSESDLRSLRIKIENELDNVSALVNLIRVNNFYARKNKQSVNVSEEDKAKLDHYDALVNLDKAVIKKQLESGFDMEVNHWSRLLGGKITRYDDKEDIFEQIPSEEEIKKMSLEQIERLKDKIAEELQFGVTAFELNSSRADAFFAKRLHDTNKSVEALEAKVKVKEINQEFLQSILDKLNARAQELENDESESGK